MQEPVPTSTSPQLGTGSSEVRATRLSPPDLFDSSSLGFSPVVVAPPGAGLVFISGQLADDQDADFEHQVTEAFENLRIALEAAGASFRSVLRISCLVVDHDLERREVVSRARLHHFGDELPASTIFPVPRLAGPTALFEIDAIAMIDPHAQDTADR